MADQVPASLRTWFLAHFIIDVLFGIPLLLLPTMTLVLFDFPTTNSVFARLVGAALLGIGGASLSMRHAGHETYRAMLDLKVIWSLSAIVAISLTLSEGAPIAMWGFLLIFVVFSTSWIYYRFFRR
jgi:hypothetical protein